MPHHHIINVTVCGSWWSGQLDERGIPHAQMTDGAPNGYSILNIEDDTYRLDYKAAGRDRDYQMQIATDGVWKTGQLEQCKIWANVFNGSEQTRVEYQINGQDPWHEMTRTLEVDPLYQRIYDREAQLLPEITPKMSKPGICTHLWKASPPADLAAGTHLVSVRATDPDGRTVAGKYVIRVE